MKPRNKSIKFAMHSIEKLCRTSVLVYSVGDWVGKELFLMMENLEHAYIGFELNDDETKYKIKTFNCFPELHNTIINL